MTGTPPGVSAAPPIRDPTQFSPVFVLATPRSYSSVIATMIGQHPDLAGLPEVKLFGCPTVGELDASLPDFWKARGITHRSPGLVRTLAQYEFGDQTPSSLILAQAWLRDRARWSGADVFDVLLRRLDPLIAVEKSPENVATDAALARLSAAYPRARYLHLTRHPATTQRSMQQHWMRITGRNTMPGQPTAGLVAWLEIHQRILQFCAALPRDRSLRMRAEDILNDTDRHLYAVAAWLGLRIDEAAIEAMKHPESSPFACLGPADSGIIGGHDPAFLTDPTPRRAELPLTVDRPDGWSASRSLWHGVAHLAEQLGYGRGTVKRAPASVTSGPKRRVARRVSRELLRRRDIGQTARSNIAGPDPEAIETVIRIDDNNTVWLKKVVERIGWPARSLVGEEAAHAAWLLAQHADRDPVFQRHCLELMEQAASLGDVSLADLAHLTDRVRLANGEQQVYGTQAVAHEGRYTTPRLHDPDSVNTRRASLGLDSLEDHLARVLDRYGPPSPARTRCPDCGDSVEVWLPELGGQTVTNCVSCGSAITVRARMRTRVASSQATTRRQGS